MILLFIKHCLFCKTKGQHNWLSSVKFILRYCGIGDVWLNPSKISNESLGSKCNVILRNKYIEYWFSLLDSTESRAVQKKKNSTQRKNKLRTYSLIKKEYKIEDYLNNRDERKMLAKLKCSNHCLLFETGRHNNKDVSDCKCTVCDKIEDEIHFTVECQLYRTTRSKYFNNCNITCDNKKSTFISLFLSKTTEVIKHLARFVTNPFEIRKLAITG